MTEGRRIKNSCTRTDGHTDQSKVVQEVLADLKSASLFHSVDLETAFRMATELLSGVLNFAGWADPLESGCSQKKDPLL